MVQSVKVDFTGETSTKSSSVLEAERRTGIPEPSIRHILHEMLDLYPYIIQVLHQLLPADTGARQNFATWMLTQMECKPQWFLNVMWTDNALFSLQGGVNTQNSHIWETSNSPEDHSQSLHSPHVTVWCGFREPFILRPYFFEEPCPVPG